MKRNIALLAILLYIYSCKKDDNSLYNNPLYSDKTIFSSGNVEKGFISAKKNGLDWKAAAEGIIYKPEEVVRLGISGYTFNTKGEERESFGFFDMPFAVQKYSISSQESDDNLKKISFHFGRLAADGDVVADLPHLIIDDTVSSNYFEITRLDTASKILEARFDVSLRSDKTKSNYKDEKMHFSSGLIQVKLRRK